ncbi:MAG TPA: phosphotransferase [Pseudonocardiaceae bacterium]
MNEESSRLQVVTGPMAGAALTVAVEAAGGRLVSWRPSQVDHRPDRVTAAYRARVRWGRQQRARTETFGATVGDRLPDGVTVVSDGLTRIGVWRVPHDPELPGLAAATDPAAVRGVLRGFGVPATTVRLTLRSYRPRRRAVVEAAARGGRIFLKVVKPARAKDLHERHRLIAAAGLPVPQSLGWTDDGLVVLARLPGVPLREALRVWHGPWPDVEEVTRLLDALPGALAEGPARPSWAERAPHFAARVSAAVPELTRRVHDLAAEIHDGCEAGPVVPIHGDLYEQQVLVDGGRVCGLLDLDTAGPGDRLDDVGCLLGHLDVLAQVWPRQGPTIAGLGARYLDALDRTCDPRQLRLRIAAVALSLATGPHRVQEPGWRRVTARRIDLVERWVVRANHHQ